MLLQPFAGFCLCEFVGVQMMAQHIADHVINHAFAQTPIHHPRQRLGQGRVGNQLVRSGPEALNQAHIDKGGQIIIIAGRGIDDVFNTGRIIGFIDQINRNAAPVEFLAQGRFIERPLFRLGPKQDFE